ncbi:MAG TPA: hypothetical protein VM487_00075 [Phycisphaerae bacterium]|nr:hypothetical protein [Phycisphaerae bacterium]
MSKRAVPKCDEQEYLALFEARDWTALKTRFGDDNFLITDFTEFNLTPFSYDLSLGSQVFSIQKPGKGVLNVHREATYPLQPGEAVIVMTEELIAIPPRYSATVWPRFNIVRAGVFQSMVKIDPTWYGNLAIAICNLSPSPVELKPGTPFATLILYELTKPTDVDLWRHQDLTEVEVPLTEEVQGLRDRFDAFLSQHRKDLTNYCRLQENTLWVRGLKQSQVEALKTFDNNPNWQRFVKNTLAPSWAKATHEKSRRRMIGMEALGMTDLREIVDVGEYEQLATEERRRQQRESLRGQACEFDDLTAAAVEYGRPFDLVPKLWTALVQKMEERADEVTKEALPLMKAEVEAVVFPKVVLLTLTVLGFLSLVFAVIAFVVGKYALPKDLLAVDWPMVAQWSVAGVFIVVGVCIAMLLRSRVPRWPRVGELEKKLQAIKKRVDKMTSQGLEKRLKAIEKRVDEMTSQGSREHERKGCAQGRRPYQQ